MIQGVTTQIKETEEKIIGTLGAAGKSGLIPAKDSSDQTVNEIKMIWNEIREQRTAVNDLI